VDNVKTFTEEKSLSVQETDLILEIAEGMKNSIPCTACKYCTSGCPMGLDIPGLIATYNEIRFAPVVNSVMHLQAMSDDKQPSACIACGKCSQICPQGIDIPQVMKDFTEALDKIPKWADICRQREEEAKKMMK